MALDTAKFKDLFISEAEEQIATLSRVLLDIEQDPTNVERYAMLMRSAHTIKGSAATMGYNEIARLAHIMEDLFRAGEKGEIVLQGEAVSVALSGVDLMTQSLAAIKLGGNELSAIEVTDALGLVLTNAALKNAIAKEGGALGGGEENKTIKTEEKEIPQTGINAAVTHGAPALPYAVPTNIKVSIERLDALMGLFEELLMVRLKLEAIIDPARDIVKSVTDPVLKQRLFFINEFKSLFSELGRLISETQSELMEIRLVPLEQIFAQFPRMVRDLSLREGKQVQLTIEGSAVELDRTVLEGLGGALAHLLRNAVDHGIATKGNIYLRAKRVRDRVHVSVEDDGTGIDYARVREVAVERGIISSAEGTALNNADIADMLFTPNLSTNKTVTEISGRGVGLSAVRAFTLDVGGRVSVESPVSQTGGTRFLIDLPISLATVQVLLVESSSFTFAIPFSNIIRTLFVPKDAILKAAHQETVVLDEKPLPVLRLDRLLGITFGSMFSRRGDEEKHSLVLLAGEHSDAALLVDKCIGERELLVKSLPPVLRGIKGFSGSALLPDGRTILLLDVRSLLLRAFDDILGEGEEYTK